MRFKLPKAWFSRLILSLAEYMALIGGIVVFILMLLITADAFGRKLGSPVPGALELSEASMVAIAFLPLMYVQMRREHVFVSIFTRRLSPQLQSILDAIAALTGLIVFTLLTWVALQKAWDAWLIGEYRMGVVHLPIWPFRALIPLGLGLLCLQLVITVCQEVKKATRIPLEKEVGLQKSSAST